MKNKILTLCMSLAMLVMTSAATAGAIIGTIEFQGLSKSVTDDQMITSVTFGRDITTTADGGFSGVDGGEVTFTNLDSIGPTDNLLWSVGDFTFKLTTITVNTLLDGGGATFSGTGTLNGDDETIYTWSYTTVGIEAGNSGESSFTASITAAVPAPAGVALLGFALLGFGTIRRRRGL